MRPLLFVLPLLALMLSACYETAAPVLAEGVRADAVRDGRWRRADGSEVVLAWDEGLRAYRVGAGGHVRLAPLGGLWLADYQAARNVVLLARLAPDSVVLYAPTAEAEKRAMAAHGLSLRPGPVHRLSGDPDRQRRFLRDLAALDGTPDLREAERLVWIGPL